VSTGETGSGGNGTPACGCQIPCEGIASTVTQEGINDIVGWPLSSGEFEHIMNCVSPTQK
jgi:hypothetical protein